MVISKIDFVGRNAFVAPSDVKVLGLLVIGSYLGPANIVANVAGRIDRHVMAVPDGAASSVQTLFAPLVARHVVVRLLTHLVMDYTPAAHVIYLLHVLPATASANYPRTIDFRQLQSGLAWIPDQSDIMRIVLAP